MAKRDEIREGTAFELWWIEGGAGDREESLKYWESDYRARNEWKNRAMLLLRYLDSMDVVIRKEGELPSAWDGKGEVMSALTYIKKIEDAGLVATERLIPGGN